jgi:cell division protein FtsL
MKKQLLMLFMALTLSCAAFMLVDQVHRYDRLMSEVRGLDARQSELFEENKRSIVNIAILKAPERIDRIARELGMEKGDRNTLIQVQPAPLRRSADG